MAFGTFSVSLAVKDIAASRKFYEEIGFKPFAGEQSQKWLIMKNGEHVIGLFQGMFEQNILTFNPGWDQYCNKRESFIDIRELHRQFQLQGIVFDNVAIESESGPASFSITDPDGNKLLFDQHV